MVLLVIMRLLHVMAGIFWAGTMFFTARFLFPAIQETGPDGAKVGAALQRLGFMTIMPIVALVTILSGLYLYWRDSGGFQSGWMRSGMGTTLGIGALCAVVAFIIGIVVARPAMMRATVLAQSAAQANAAERDGILKTAQALRERSNRATRIVTLLIALAAAAMAVARYV